MTNLELELTSTAILRQLPLIKSRAEIDRYLDKEKASEMTKIEAAAPQMAQFIRNKADAAKKALPR